MSEEPRKRQQELQVTLPSVAVRRRQVASAWRESEEFYRLYPCRQITQRWRVEGELQEAHAGLERRVEELTAELAQANTRLKEETAQRKRAETAAWTSADEIRQLNRIMERRARRLPALQKASQAIATASDPQEVTSQSHLIQVEKMAALGRLAATLAHEINNPLQAMQSHLELAMDFPLPQEERTQYLGVIRQEISRLSDITQRVLNFSRPAVVQPRPVSIAELVSQTLALTSKQLQRSHVQVTTDIPESLQVLAVPDQLVQVFLNLIINATEAIHDHGHIQINAHAEGPRGVVSFANDGPAIPPEHLSRIFEPFFTSKPEGTGLGLAVSHNLVQQHGGTLTAKNQPNGTGVEFTIGLPLM